MGSVQLFTRHVQPCVPSGSPAAAEIRHGASQYRNRTPPVVDYSASLPGMLRVQATVVGEGAGRTGTGWLWLRTALPRRLQAVPHAPREVRPALTGQPCTLDVDRAGSVESQSSPSVHSRSPHRITAAVYTALAAQHSCTGADPRPLLPHATIAVHSRVAVQP
jgi:hypothetical protein